MGGVTPEFFYRGSREGGAKQDLMAADFRPRKS